MSSFCLLFSKLQVLHQSIRPFSPTSPPVRRGIKNKPQSSLQGFGLDIFSCYISVITIKASSACQGGVTVPIQSTSLFISRCASLTLVPRLASRQLWFTASSSSVTLSKCCYQRRQRLFSTSSARLVPSFFESPLKTVKILLKWWNIFVHSQIGYFSMMTGWWLN